MLEQPRTEAASARLANHRHAELGHRAALRIGWGIRMGQMRHRDQLEAAVEDAEHFVLVEIERVDIAGDLRIRGRIAETQVAVALFQAQQVSDDPVVVAGAERADRNPAPLGRMRFGRAGRGGALGRIDGDLVDGVHLGLSV